MTAKEQQEYREKSGLTPEILRGRVLLFGDKPYLTTSPHLYHYAKQVCQEAFGPDFYQDVLLRMRGDQTKYGWGLHPRTEDRR